MENVTLEFDPPVHLKPDGLSADLGPLQARRAVQSLPEARVKQASELLRFVLSVSERKPVCGARELRRYQSVGRRPSAGSCTTSLRARLRRAFSIPSQQPAGPAGMRWATRVCVCRRILAETVQEHIAVDFEGFLADAPEGQLADGAAEKKVRNV